jgi:hypothetical protein
MIVEQIRQRLRTAVEKLSQRNIRNCFGDDCFGSGCSDDGIEQILQIFGGKLASGANLLDPIQLARNTNLAIIAQGY